MGGSEDWGGLAATGTCWTLADQGLQVPQNWSVCKVGSMIQECYREPRVPCADRRMPTLLAGLGATCRRCCWVAIARRDASAPSPGNKQLCTLCALCRNPSPSSVLPKVTLLRAQDTHQSLLGILQALCKDFWKYACHLQVTQVFLSRGPRSPARVQQMCEECGQAPWRGAEAGLFNPMHVLRPGEGRWG